MARMPRFNLPGVAQHAIQRGNNRQVCFGSEVDMAAHAAWLCYIEKFEPLQTSFQTKLDRLESSW